MRIFETDLMELMELHGGGNLNKYFNFKGQIAELIITENEFEYIFDLFINDELIFAETVFMDSFEFEYFNQNENGSHIIIMVSILKNSDENKIQEIMAELNSELINNLNLNKYL